MTPTAKQLEALRYLAAAKDGTAGSFSFASTTVNVLVREGWATRRKNVLKRPDGKTWTSTDLVLTAAGRDLLAP